MYSLFFNVLIVLSITVKTHASCAEEGSDLIKITKKEKAYAELSTEYVPEELGDQVCYRYCTPSTCTYSYCNNGVCCTPGSLYSLCCPISHPLCRSGGCCPYGYPKVCGRYCCRSGSTCCGEKCCDKNGKCCSGGHRSKICCKKDKTCCGENCCDKSEDCCPGERESRKCCKKDSMACCGEGIGCKLPCPSQFDALPCENSDSDIDFNRFLSYLDGLSIVSEKTTNESDGLKYLYRVIRNDENPDAIVAKNPWAKRTVLSHVNCGSRPKYRSQFISFTTSLNVAKAYSKKSGNRIVKLTLTKEVQKHFTLFADLTCPENRQKYLGNAVCKNFAKASCEVVISSSKPIKTEVIKPPSID